MEEETWMDEKLAERWRSGFQEADLDAIRGMLTEEPSLVNEEVEVTIRSGSKRVWGPLFAAKDDLGKVQLVM